MKKIGAVIIGGHFQGLGILRSLGKHDVPVCLLDHDLCISRFSRYRKRFFRSPHPRDEERFVDFLMRLGKREGLHGWIVYPNDDDTVRLLAKNKVELEQYYTIPIPDWETTKFACEKKLTYQIATQVGIPVPKTCYPTTLQEVRALDIDFPCIVKPSVKEPFYSAIKKKAIRADNPEELTRAFAIAVEVAAGSEIMVQELLPGGTTSLYSVGSLFKNGEFLGRVVALRPRQHPMDFGHATTYAVTADLPELEHSAQRLLDAIGFYGISEVEFMLDPRSGEYKLLEVNARPWGWHSLAIAAGVDLPYLLYQDLTGETAHHNGFKSSTKWIRLTTDLPTAAGEILKRNLKLTDYLNSLRGDRHFAVLSLDDPLPFVAEIIMSPYLWRKRGF